MRFGVRDIVDVTLRAKTKMQLGSRTFFKNEPVLYFDTLKTSSLDGAATTVYATGGRGNPRLIAWEGERTLTFTFEDALISPESFSVLSGAGLIDASKEKPAYIHTTSQVEVKEKNKIELPSEPCWNRQYARGEELYHEGADIYVMTMTNGQIDSEPCIPVSIDADKKTLTCYGHAGGIDVGDIVLVDYYVKKTTGVKVIEITADKFGGNFYLEGYTLFRDEATGVDMPAEFVIPNGKIQSNFTFTMASTGDPSTFTFTMDCFPDYTKFDKTHKVLAELQIVTDDVDASEETREPCRPTEIAGYEGAGINVTYDNSGTEALVKVVAEGSGIDGGINADSTKYYSNELFGDLSAKGNAVELDVKFDSTVIDSAKKYTVVQDNPALKAYWPTEFATGVKTKTYEPGELDDGYALILSDKTGPISVTLKDEENKIIQVIQITNKVTFASKKVAAGD